MVVLRVESCVPNENGTVAATAETANISDAFDVELMKKPGKGLGLSIVGRKSGSGIFISDIVSSLFFKFFPHRSLYLKLYSPLSVTTIYSYYIFDYIFAFCVGRWRAALLAWTAV